MSKTRFFLFTLIVAIATLTICLCGCNKAIESDNSKSSKSQSSYGDSSSAENIEECNCVVIYSQHSNSKVSADDKIIAGYIRKAKDAQGYFNIVRLDGDPSEINSEIDLDTTNEKKNSKNIEKENKEFVEDVIEELENVKAEEKEVDVIEAIKEANDLFDSKSDLPNVVVLAATGLSTKGIVNFASNGLDSTNLSDYANWVSKQMPKLENIDKIVWSGFDEVAEPQSEFPYDKKSEEVKDFYKTIFKTAGIDNVEFKKGSTTKELDSSLPTVSVVKMPPELKYQSGESETLSDGESGITFSGDSADIDTNNQKVKDIADSIKNGDLKVTITGYTADHDTSAYGGNDGLAQARADAVKNALVGLGCSESNITTKSGGVGNKGSDEANRCVDIAFE